jgi:hypothetical protein
LEAYGLRDLSAKGTNCSVNPEGTVVTPENGGAQTGWPIGNLRPSLANEEVPLLVPNGIDAHRAPLQATSLAFEEELLTRLVASFIDTSNRSKSDKAYDKARDNVVVIPN